MLNGGIGLAAVERFPASLPLQGDADDRSRPVQQVVESLAVARASIFAASVHVVSVLFRAPRAGDPDSLVGEARYVRVSKAEIDARRYPPSTWFQSGDRFLPDGDADNLNGGYWLIAESVIDPLMLGARGGGPDATPAINDAILKVALDGGGQVRLGSVRSHYQINGTILIPSNVRLDLGGQTLKGLGSFTGIMFQTAWLDDGVLRNNLVGPADVEIVGYAGVANGIIRETGKIFQFRNFNYGCTIRDVHAFSCPQFGVFDRCFYLSIEDCSARGPAEQNLPSFDFAGSNNLVNLRRVSCTTPFAFQFRGGSAGVVLSGCSAEGGHTGIKFVDDCLGFSVEGGYWEAITGVVFDLGEAGNVSIDFAGNYLNYCDTVINQGGTVFGDWASSNVIANVGRTYERVKYDGLVDLSSERNFLQFEVPFRNANSGELPSVPDNIVMSKSSRVAFESGWAGTSLQDVRARSRYFGEGIIPLVRAGDVGDPYPGSVPFCEVSIPQGADVIATVKTGIAWRPNSLSAKFIFAVRGARDDGDVKVFGDIYGDVMDRRDKSPLAVSISDQDGRLVISIAGLDNRTRRATVTGSVQILA